MMQSIYNATAIVIPFAGLIEEDCSLRLTQLQADNQAFPTRCVNVLFFRKPQK